MTKRINNPMSSHNFLAVSVSSVALLLASVPAAAQSADAQKAGVQPAAPADLTEQIFLPAEPAANAEEAIIEAVSMPVWSTDHAGKLLTVIEAIGTEGLNPADYKPEELASQIAKGASLELDAAANRSFSWLIEDLRDGRTPQSARLESYVDDPDAQDMPTQSLLTKAIDSGDIVGIINSVAPTHPDYAKLRAQLATIAESDAQKRKLIVANMDRWRWFARDLGPDYLHTNIPEYQLRFVINKQQVGTYKTIVGSPKNATPQLAESVSGIVFNPTWTVPQSIVKGEGLGNRVLSNPVWAARKGYKATRGENGYISVVQAPGPINSLGHVKLHMPNRHAIFFHDTPSRGLFNRKGRALSHGCIRTERAMELAMTIALVRGDIPIERSVELQKSLEYKLVPIERELPAYLTYLTMATDINGKMRSFSDIYGRDAAIHKAFEETRPATPIAAVGSAAADDDAES